MECPVLCALANIQSCPLWTSQFKVTSRMCALANIKSHLVCVLTNIRCCFSVWTGLVCVCVCVQANIWPCFYACMSQHTVLSWMCTSQHNHCVITVTVIAKWQVLSHPSLVTNCRSYQFNFCTVHLTVTFRQQWHNIMLRHCHVNEQYKVQWTLMRGPMLDERN